MRWTRFFIGKDRCGRWHGQAGRVVRVLVLGFRRCLAAGAATCPPNTPLACLPARSPLMRLRQNETPIDQLPVLPPGRLLPALLAFLRASLPTPFRYLTILTRTALMNHLWPFMWLRSEPQLGGLMLRGGRGKRGR